MKEKVAVLTDTNSGIMGEEAEKKGIYVMPMPVIIENEIFYEGQNSTVRWKRERKSPLPNRHRGIYWKSGRSFFQHMNRYSIFPCPPGSVIPVLRLRHCRGNLAAGFVWQITIEFP